MAKRHEEAILIQRGASNPIDVSKALDRAITEVREEGGQVETDEAVRLIVHQLAFLTTISQLDRDLSEYGRCLDKCEGISGLKLKPVEETHHENRNHE